jgi:peptidoglycan hydrolase-like protein with peptidoglycan-binding domain
MKQSIVKCAFVTTILLSAAGALAQQSGQPPSATSSGIAAPAVIRSIQNELGRLGYYAGPMDGRAGAETTDAIRRYEHDKGLPPDGQASTRLWSFMQAASSQQGNQQRPQGTTMPGGTHINPNGTFCCR